VAKNREPKPEPIVVALPDRLLALLAEGQITDPQRYRDLASALMEAALLGAIPSSRTGFIREMMAMMRDSLMTKTGSDSPNVILNTLFSMSQDSGAKRVGVYDVNLDEPEEEVKRPEKIERASSSELRERQIKEIPFDSRMFERESA